VLTNRKAYIPTRRQKNALSATQTLFEQFLWAGLEALIRVPLPGEQKQKPPIEKLPCASNLAGVAGASYTSHSLTTVAY
jgi:hypothetical protein